MEHEQTNEYSHYMKAARLTYRCGITIHKLIILQMKSTQQHDDGSSLSGDGSVSEYELYVPSVKCFSLSSVDLRDDTEQLSTQLDEFRTAPFSTSKCRFPPMITLLQHFEVFLSSTDIKKVSQIVSSYCKKQKRNHRIQEYVDDTRHLYSSLRQLIGVLAFDRVSRHIRNGGDNDGSWISSLSNPEINELSLVQSSQMSSSFLSRVWKSIRCQDRSL